MDKPERGRPKEAHYYARLTQNYRLQREICNTCTHYRFSREPAEWAVKLYPNDLARQKASAVDKGQRCALGQFPVKSTATCDSWALKVKEKVR